MFARQALLARLLVAQLRIQVADAGVGVGCRREHRAGEHRSDRREPDPDRCGAPLVDIIPAISGEIASPDVTRGGSSRRAPRGSGAASRVALVMHPYALPMDAERKREIFAADQGDPEGFVRTYGDVSPGAPRMAGAALSEGHGPELPWYRIVRADGSLAKGAKQRSCSRPRASHSAATASTCERRGCPISDVGPARDHAAATAPGIPSGHPGAARRAARAARAAGRPAAPADRAHIGVAGSERERLARRAPGLRVVGQRRGAGAGAVLDAHARGRRRHARAREGRAVRAVADDPDLARASRARYVAGDLYVRAPQPRRCALGRGDGLGRARSG